MKLTTYVQQSSNLYARNRLLQFVVMVLSAWLNPEGLAGTTQARCAAVAWVCGAGIGLLSNYGVIGLSQVASIDAILASAVVYVALRALLLRRAPVRG